MEKDIKIEVRSPLRIMAVALTHHPGRILISVSVYHP